MKKIAIFLSALLFAGSIFAIEDNSCEERVFDIKDPAVAVAKDFAEKWLGLVDQGNYQASWNDVSNITRAIVRNNPAEWEKILKASRTAKNGTVLGKPDCRILLEIRLADEPVGLPKGKYAVFFYQTRYKEFDGQELLTLHLESSNDALKQYSWKILTYQMLIKNKAG